MKKIILNILKFITFLSLGVVMMWLAFRDFNWQEFVGTLKKANYWWVALSMVIAYIGFWARAKRWQLLIEPLGYKVGLENAYHGVMIGYGANFLLPRIGEVSRCAVLNRTDKVPFDALIGTVIIERAMDLLMLILMLVFVFFAKLNFFGSYLHHKVLMPVVKVFQQHWLLTLVFVLFCIACVTLVFVFKSRIKKVAMVQKISALGKGVKGGIITAFKMKRKFEFLLYSVIIWVGCYWIMTWIPVLALPATANLDLMDGMFLLVIGGIAITAPVQGGYGVFHGAIILALTTLYQMKIVDARAFAVIIHESQSFMMIILGIFSFVYISLRNRKKKTEQ